MLYPDGFRQDHSYILDSRVGQEWILLQAKVKLDWPSRAHVMNTVESTWIEVEDSAGKHACPPSSNELWTLVLDILDEIATLQPYVQLLIESEIIGESTGVLDILIKRSVLENSPFNLLTPELFF
jgi:hypothetical protein